MNPLLSLPAVPPFDVIQADQVVPAITTLVAQATAGLDALEAAMPPGFEALMAVHRLFLPLGRAWGVVNHLLSVKNSPELRAAHQAVQPGVVALYARLGQSAAIYQALTALREGPAWAGLDPLKKRAVELELRDMRLSGVGLEGPAKERFTAIQLELSELSTSFSNHLLDATKAWSLVLTDPRAVDGLPLSLKAQLAAKAGGTAEAGPWTVTLDFPSYGPFLEHCRRTDLREQVYRAFITRASTGDLDNQPLMVRILALRQEQAALLGYATPADVSLAAKMAPGVAAVEALLTDLRRVAKPKAEAELAELTAYARNKSGDPALVLNLWDVAFWAERLREERYSYTDEELRPYFALPQVLDGLFALAERAFGIRVVAADGEVPVWDPTVRFFRVQEATTGAPLAAFYLDPYSRPADKRGGAWMNNCLGRELTDQGTVQLPVAYLVCNQTPPVGDVPSLMTFREVETLFHEFGHGLQHMLTKIELPQIAGINGVEWDAVELPSQFMENWCYDEATVLGGVNRPGLARHWRTGEPLPAALFARIRAARTYRAATMTLRQGYMSLLDLALHGPATTETPRQVQERIARDNTVLPPLPEDRFLCSFSHIFAGGYAAGYYSYKWAEVLSADAFAAFVEAGVDDAAVATTGRRFRDTILGEGGSRHPLEVFRTFRGREPRPEALLKQCGLLN